MTAGSVHLRSYGSGDAADVAAAVWDCYDEVFGDVDDFQSWREDPFGRHVAREGFRLAVASEGERVVGFAWGYVGRRGQFWTDLAAEALPDTVVAEWVGGHFELVELGVRADFRRQGLGQDLHDRLLDGVDRRCLLSTSDDPADPAVRLYLRSGWEPLGRLGPGVQVLGRRPQHH